MHRVCQFRHSGVRATIVSSHSDNPSRVDTAGRMEVIDELCSFEGRLTGTDAERRAANRVAERLRKQGAPGRGRADLRPSAGRADSRPPLPARVRRQPGGRVARRWSALRSYSSLRPRSTSTSTPASTSCGASSSAAFRRTSSRARPDRRRKSTLLLCAHIDAARTGLIYKPGRLAAIVRMGRALQIEVTPTRLIFWSLALLVPVVGIHAAGLDSTAISVIQLLPTLILLIALFALVRIEVSDVVPGANDNASGVATVLSLAEDLDARRPSNLDVWVVITGGEECLFEGMRSFLRRHRKQLDPATTWVVNVDSVGRGDVRYVTSDGLAVSFDYSSRLTQLCDAIAEADAEGERRYRASGWLTASPPTHSPHGFASCDRRQSPASSPSPSSPPTTTSPATSPRQSTRRRSSAPTTSRSPSSAPSTPTWAARSERPGAALAAFGGGHRAVQPDRLHPMAAGRARPRVRRLRRSPALVGRVARGLLAVDLGLLRRPGRRRARGGPRRARNAGRPLVRGNRAQLRRARLPQPRSATSSRYTTGRGRRPWRDQLG